MGIGKYIALITLLVVAACATSPTGNTIGDTNNAQKVTVGLSGSQYVFTPSTVKAGQPVLLVRDNSLMGCSVFMVQRDLGVQANFGENKEYLFTPQKPGTYTFSCTMNMFHGTLQVI